MNIEQYFQREYNFLQVAGEKFAEKHQDIAGRLRLTERQRKDPFVERLLEAFAFLAGRIHERLDDEIPEFTGGLLEQLFPHFLRPFPSCAIAEVNPIQGALSKPVVIPSRSEMRTPTGKYKIKYRVAASPEEGARIIEKTEKADFIFRTCFDLVVRPMQLKEVRLEEGTKVPSALVLQIQPHRNTDFESLQLDRLALYLQGDKFLSYNLLLYLNKYVSSIFMKELSGSRQNEQQIKSFKFGIPGLSNELKNSSEDQALIPYARQSFKGFRILQEYFAFTERFFFIEIEGLESFQATKGGLPFEITINFSQKFSKEYRPSTKNILLHCTPIVNLFDQPAEEVSVSQRLPEYYIVPDLNRRKSKEIYSVNTVDGISENRLQQYTYTPITSYDILDKSDPDYDYKRFYSALRREVTGDMAETYLRLFGTSMELDTFPKETLSIQATFTNGILPAKYLEVGAISEPVDFPSGVNVKNITAPSDVLPYPERQNFLWALINHLNLSLGSLAEVEIFKNSLSLYNWSPSYNNPNKKRIQSITKIYPPETKHFFRNRGLIRGIEFKLEFDKDQFEYGEGDIHLFGTVLSNFLSQYITINSFVILKMIETSTKKEYVWQPNLGSISPV